MRPRRHDWVVVGFALGLPTAMSCQRPPALGAAPSVSPAAAPTGERKLESPSASRSAEPSAGTGAGSFAPRWQATAYLVLVYEPGSVDLTDLGAQALQLVAASLKASSRLPSC